MRARGSRNVWLVTRREFVVTISRRSFWLTTFLLPLALLALVVGMQVWAQRSLSDEALPSAGQVQSGGAVGYVDESGILLRLPPGADDRALLGFADEASAHEALRQGQISNYYVVSSDYLRSGGLTLVQKAFRPLAAASVSPLLTYALGYNLAGGDRNAQLVAGPTLQVESKSLAPAEQGGGASGSLAFAVPTATLFILYLVLVMSGGFMLTSVVKEKENRTAEILLVSLRARDLMLGKILGLAGVALLQMAVWLGAGVVALGQARHAVESLGTYQLPGGFIPLTLVYFLLGFLLYASLFAALGVIARTVREASQLSYVALVPLIVPMLASSTLIENPQGGLAVALSLIPLTSPVAMVTRLAVEAVPIWQLAAGLVLLAAAAYAVVLLAARFFRVENLLSNRAFSWRRLAQQFGLAGPTGR
jgi:ABC-2 type transport system permease protein